MKSEAKRVAILSGKPMTESVWSLYGRLRYELAPVGVTTMGSCAKGCGEYARGSGTCRNCLVAELQAAAPGFDWSAFVETMQASKVAIIDAETAIDKAERK